MIITDLSYLTMIRDREKIIGAKGKRVYDNRGVSTARSYAYGSKAYAISGTSLYLDRGISQGQSFSEASASNEESINDS